MDIIKLNTFFMEFQSGYMLTTLINCVGMGDVVRPCINCTLHKVRKLNRNFLPRNVLAGKKNTSAEISLESPPQC